MKNKRPAKIFLYITILLFFINWIFIYSIFYFDSTVDWWFAIFLSFFSIISFYVFILLSHEKRTNMILGIIIFLPTIFLARQRALEALPFFLLAYFSYWVAINKRIKREQFGRIKLEIYRILKRGRTYLMLAISLMIAVGFYFSMINNQRYVEAPHFEIQVPEFVGTLSVWVIDFITPNQDIEASTTIDDLIRGSLEQEAATQEEPMKSLTTSDFMIEEARESLSRQLGVELSGNETMSQMVSGVLSSWINTTINRDIGKGKAVPIGAASALGLTLYALLWLVSFVQFWIAWGILVLLKRRGKIEISKKNMEVERIV